MKNIQELTFEQFIEYYVRKKLSLQEIGDIYGVSRQRIHQIKKHLESIHGKIQRKNTLDSFTLKKLLDSGISVKDIADMHHLKISKVNRLIRKCEEEYKLGLSPIKVVRKKSKDILTKGLLYQLYVNEKLTDKEIASKYHVSPTTVWLLRKEYQIESYYTKSLRRTERTA